ncbi:glycosyltransferase family 4 protein [Rhodopirellula halodulae]|uniref:glycosyltransferase family 4 protein n=1 Tax=Rhodopirellula halodulae TaxID=2894198 RepID=UPI001E5644EE|nr:glycosyltransferase family 4 protein [Rhodopirellula sp. JC737]MCC9658713.1 glycosyltransferase family 4 protein [Rhodopirellula sp. JC737]
MRILAVHSYYRQRGGEDVVFDAETELLQQRGHDVVRFTRQNDSLSGGSALSNAQATIWNRVVARDLVRAIQDHGSELVHFHNTFPAISASAIRAAHESGTATVLTLHNSRLLCPRAVCFRAGQPCEQCVASRFNLPAIRHGCFHDSRMASAVVALNNWLHRNRKTYQRFLDLAIAPTHFVKQRYEASSYPMPPIEVKPHFVEAHLEPGQGDGGYALFVGRLSEEKGLNILLDAWQQLSQPLPLKLIGDGPMIGMMKSLPENIEYLGRLDQESVYRAMADAAVLILPSHCAESFGRVVVEAFASGTPVITANQGGQAELVHSLVGATFESGNAKSLADVVDRFVIEAEQSIAMREVARQEYEDKYSADSNYEWLIRLYHEALGNRVRRRAAETPAMRNRAAAALTKGDATLLPPEVTEDALHRRRIDASSDTKAPLAGTSSNRTQASSGPPTSPGKASATVNAKTSLSTDPTS